MPTLALLHVAADGVICSDLVVATKPIANPAPPDLAREDPVKSLSQLSLDVLFKQHSSYVARLAYRMLGSQDEVDDIVQDVFVALYGHLSNIRENDAIRGWLGTTTVRMVARRLRVRRIGFLLRIGSRCDPAELEARGVAPEDRAALLAVHRALTRVPVRAKVAWILRYVEEERMEDVARLCGCSLATAKRRVARAHRSVRRAVVDD